MGARCNGCGKPVMPYGRYLLHSSSTAICEGCGARVRLRRYRLLVAAGVLLLAGLFAAVMLLETKGGFVAATLVIVVLALAVDYTGYRTLSWDPVDQPSV